MTFGNIQRVEVVKISFDLPIIFNQVAERNENVFDALAHQSYWMEMSWPRTPSGNRDVETIAFSSGTRKDFLAQSFLSGQPEIHLLLVLLYPHRKFASRSRVHTTD